MNKYYVKTKYHVQETIKGFHLYSFGILRKLYFWTVSWVKSPYAELALFLVAFSDSIFFPIPPEVLFVALAISFPSNSYRYAFITLIASVSGAIVGYFFGFFFYEAIGIQILQMFNYQQQFMALGELFNNNAFMVIFSVALSPLPYKVIVLAAGLFEIHLLTFVFASFIGLAIRYYAIATIIHLFGKQVKYFIDKYVEWIMMGVFLLVVGLYLLFMYVL